MGDMKDHENDNLSGDGLDEELSQIRDAFQQELDEATKRAEQNAQSRGEEAPPASQVSPVSAAPAADAPASAGEQKADWKVIVLAVIVALWRYMAQRISSSVCRLLHGCCRRKSMFARRSSTLRSMPIMMRARIQRPRRQSVW